MSKRICVDGPINLGQFLKLAGVAETGGEAKAFVREGQVWVNGQREYRRGRRLAPGDVVTLGGEEYLVEREEQA